MKRLINTAPLCLLAIYCRSQTIERQVMAASGMEYQAAGLNVSATLGEPLTHTIGTGATTLTQGFHQPTLLITSLDGEEETGLILFPNPTEGLITLRSELTKPTPFQLNDVNGRTVCTQVLNGTADSIDMSELPSGTYILRVKLPDNRTGSYRIIKN